MDLTKVTVITVKSIADPMKDREIRSFSYVPGESLKSYIQNALPFNNDELAVVHNCQVVPAELISMITPEPGDTIAIMPYVAGGGDDGKNILSSIAAIALMFASFGVGNLVQYGTVTGSMAGWQTGAYLAAMGAQLAGGWLMSSLAPHPKMEKQDPSYSWGPMSALSRQGAPVGLTYGTVRMGRNGQAQLLTKPRTTTDGEKQYLNMLLCGGEGPIDHYTDPDTGEIIVNGISDIRINDNPITNYQGVEIELRAGLNDQTPISYFGDTYADQELSYELQEGADWSTHQTEGDAGEGLEITFQCPALYSQSSSGKIRPATVEIQAEYRKQNSDGTWPTTWTSWTESKNVVTSYNVNFAGPNSFSIPGQNATRFFTPGKQIYLKFGSGYEKQATVVSSMYSPGSYVHTDVTVDVIVPSDISSVEYRETVITNLEITAASQNVVRKSFRKNNLDSGRYEVRVKCLQKGGTNTRVFWSVLSHITYQDFARPNKVLVGIRALATDQLSGSMPEVTWLQTRSKVWVWNPTTSAYEEKPANNPAWAIYDIFHGARRLYDQRINDWVYVVRGVPASRMVYQSFKNWADFCDNKGITCNIHIHTIADLWNTIRPIEEVGRGKAFIQGTLVSCICDAPGQVLTQIFNESNTIIDTMNLQYLGQGDRANAIEVTFYNKDKNYERDIVTVYSDDYDNSSTVTNPVQIELNACTSYEQAFKEAKYRLMLNKYIIRTVSFGAWIDALSCGIGDLIGVKHNLTNYQKEFAGRVKLASGNSVLVDKPVTMEAGKNYTIMTQLANDDFLEKDIVSPVPSFTRASTAYKKDGSEVASGVVRYEDTPFGKGIMVEEGTTNRNRDPFLSDINKVSVKGVSGAAGTKEEVSALMYGTKAVKVTCTNAGAVRLYDNAPNFTWTSGETAAVSCIVAVSKPSLISNFYLAIRASNGTAITTTVSQSAKLLYDNVYLLTGILTLTSSGLGAAGLQFNTMQPGDWFIVDAWQSEQKSYPTSITSGTRQPEVVTIKHGLTPEQGTIEGIFEVNDLSKRQISGHFPRIFGLPIVGDNDRGIGFCHAPTSADWWFQVGDADGTDTVNIPDSLTPNGFYRYRVTWTSALARIELFSLATKQRVATASIANPKLPSAFAENLNIGGTGTAATACSNTIHADIRCSSIARTDTEYGLDAPLPVDEYTTAKVGFDGELTAEAQILKVSSAYTADSDAVSYVDLTHFRVAGDKTGTYTAGAVVILEYGYNDLMEATVISSAFDGANTTVECTGPVPSTLYSVRYGFTEPKEHDRFWFGESTTQIKPYRIINIKRTDDLKCSITALEYNEAVYAEVDVPEQDTSTVIGTVDVNVSEHIDPLSKLLYLDVSWTPPREYFGAIIEINGRKVKDASINETSFSMPVDALGTYAVKVTTLDFFRVPFAVGEVFYETVYTPAPPKPDGFITVATEKGFQLMG